MRRKNIQYIILFVASLGMLASCVSSQKEANQVVTVTPGLLELTPDSMNQLTIKQIFHVTKKALRKRNRLVITPQWTDGKHVEEYTPLILDASIYSKKKHRKEVLEHFVDPYQDKIIKAEGAQVYNLSYEENVQLPEGAANGKLVAVISSDGCGECSGIDTLSIGALNDPITLMKDVEKELQLSWVEPKFVIHPKVIKKQGLVRLHFDMNLAVLNPEKGNNGEEMGKMKNTLVAILKDTLYTLNSIAIKGVASADGSLSFNTGLARRRAVAAKEWLMDQVYLSEKNKEIISVGSRPEGWEPILSAMITDGNPDSVLVKDILKKYAQENDDVQERYIRRLPCWNTIKERYLSKDRVVEYVYTYTIRSFTTDKELLDMYSKRMDAFNEGELLRVSSLVTTSEEKKQVYRNILKYFPQSSVASNNLAVLLLREGDSRGAQQVLAEMVQYSPELLNTLAASYVYAADYERAIELLQEVELPEARYNLGLLKAKKRHFNEAYSLLRPFADLNAAIVALSINKNEDAKMILTVSKDEGSVAEYARSLVGARLNEDTYFYQHIGNACQNEVLRKRAANEFDFFRYYEDPKFFNLVK